MTPAELAAIVADYLARRDDIAHADVSVVSGAILLTVRTQGGNVFLVEVTDA